MVGKHVLIGSTGSVASTKIPLLISELQKADPEIDIQVVSTEKALHFYKKNDLNVPVFTDADEWEAWSAMGDPVLHIELRKWSDVLLIAPLDANTMGKIASGICDNLLTSVVRAWDLKKPLLFALAMNTCMWQHPITGLQRDTLAGFGYTEVPSVSKKLACGDTGMGGMAEVPTLVSAVLESLKCQPAVEDKEDDDT